MLFNSYPFLFLYLPVVLGGFFLLGAFRPRAAAFWLALASVTFYGWWNWRFVPLLLASIAFNLSAGSALARNRSGRLLALAISANLAALGYFKYANFLVATWSEVTGSPLPLLDIVLPIGISFFTFTQIAFLVDAWSGKVREYRLIHYSLFVSYFPHLVAGPVLHHAQMMPQFADRETYRWNWQNVAIGMTLFAIGLCKKTLLADGVATYASPVFDAAHQGLPVYFLEAWIGALAYTLQLYFDFSGYSDMAIGLSRLFNVRLPLNFNSPYQAANIVDFWRRWHMTLSQFLRDYLYIPLGGNRLGGTRRYLNLVITMVLGGLWHGAGWTFAVWGGLHGAYLMINHGWHALRLQWRPSAPGAMAASRFGSRALTFLAVVLAWVFFRSVDLRSALYLVGSMVGMHGIAVPEPAFALQALARIGVPIVPGPLLNHIAQGATLACAWIAALLMIVWAAPNSQQIMASFHPSSDPVEPSPLLPRMRWRLTWSWAAFAALCLAIGLLQLNRVTEFLYFQF